MIDVNSFTLLAQAATTQPEREATRIIALIWLTALLAIISVVIIALLVLAWGRFTSRNFRDRKKRDRSRPNDKSDIWHESAERLKVDSDDDGSSSSSSSNPPANG